MRIAIFDIDDTITNESDFIRKKSKSYFAKYGINPIIINPNGYKIEEIFDIKSCYLEEGFSVESAENLTSHLSNFFWNKYFFYYNLQKLKPGISKYISFLKKKGYLIYFISLRGIVRSSDENKINKERRLVKLITKYMLKINHIYYDDLILVKNKEEKIDFIKRLNPEILFEDSAEIITTLMEKQMVDTRFVCINSYSNRNYEFNDTVIRINDYKNNEIKEIVLTTPKQQNYMSLVKRWNKYEIFQRITISILGRYFIKKYKAIVIGQENIPNRGAVVFVGNHRDNLDPIIISIVSGREIHWAALLRLFQGKESLFNESASKKEMNLFSTFITLMGALPIARPSDERYQEINMATINELTELLIHDRAVGFFPEGTRNRQVEEQSLLPIKSNRVFRIACETESFLVPFSISWNEDKHATIAFSKPINTRKRHKKDVRDWWLQDEEIMLKLLDKNDKS